MTQHRQRAHHPGSVPLKPGREVPNPAVPENAPLPRRAEPERQPDAPDKREHEPA